MLLRIQCCATLCTNFFKPLLSILEMGRLTYVCAACSEHFTRKFSATRHNNNLHNGTAEIVRLIDYLAGRSSGHYTPNNPFWFKRNNPLHNFGSATVADSLGDPFQPSYIHQQAPPETSQYSPSSIYPPWQDDRINQSSLSQEKILKIEELKRLMSRYPKYHMNPNGIIQWAIHCSINGNNTFLDDKLEQLRSIDRLPKYRF